MNTSKRWTVDIFIGEGQDTGGTFAEARLRTGDDTHLVGRGRAALRPGDEDVPEIGDELAAARALSHLAQRLLGVAADDIETLTHQSARVHL